MRRRALLLAALLLASCQDPVAHRDWSAMDCNFAATVHGRGSIPAEAALDTVQRMSREYEALFTDYAPSGPLSVLRGRKGDTVAPDPRITEVLREALPAMATSRGSLDIGLHDLKALWNLDAPAPHAPDSAAIDSVLRRRFGGSTDSASRSAAPLAVLPDGRVALLVDSLPIDLGGIAKGWAVDRMSDKLAQLGFPAHLIQGGGEIRARGRKASGPWRIGVKNPRATGTVAALAIFDSGMAISTSGDYERFFVENGVRYHHLFDPATGRPSRNGVASASLLCPTSAECDRWSKPMFLLGPERGKRIADSLGLSVLWILEDAHGLCGVATSSWGRRLVRDTLPACPAAYGSR